MDNENLPDNEHNIEMIEYHDSETDSGGSEEYPEQPSQTSGPHNIELMIVIFIFSLAFFFAGINYYLDLQHNSGEVLSAYVKSINVFTYFNKEERPDHIVYGFLPYWTLNQAKYLQLDKLTDIAYFGVHLNSDGTFKQTQFDEDDIEIQTPGYRTWRTSARLDDLVTLSKEKGVRFAFTVVAHSNSEIEEFLRCRSCWDTYLEELTTELNRKDIKDVHLNFEYIGDLDEENEDLALLFTQFTKFTNNALDKKYGDSFVVVSTYATSMVEPKVMDVEELAKVADGIFIMAYDFRTPNSASAGPTSPLEGIDEVAKYDVKTMVKDYVAVVPGNKLIVGVPYYGNNWIVESEEPYAKRIPGSDVLGRSQSQNFADIMDLIIEREAIVKWDENSKTPYFNYYNDEKGVLRQVYFEDRKSLKEKYKLIKQWELGGVGIWALGYDEGYVDLWELLGEEFVR